MACPESETFTRRESRQPREKRGRPLKAKALPDFVICLLEDTPKGQCVMGCERRAKRLTCGAKECRELYFTAYQAEAYLRRAGAKAAPSPASEADVTPSPLEVRPGRCDMHEMDGCWLCPALASPEAEAATRHPGRLRFVPSAPLAPDEKQSRKAEGLALLKSGKGVREVALLLRVSEATVGQWKCRDKRKAEKRAGVPS